MTDVKKLLIKTLATINNDKESKAMLIQSYIQTYGPLSEEAAEKVKELI